MLPSNSLEQQTDDRAVCLIPVQAGELGPLHDDEVLEVGGAEQQLVEVLVCPGEGPGLSADSAVPVLLGAAQLVSGGVPGGAGRHMSHVSPRPRSRPAHLAHHRGREAGWHGS